MHGKRSVNRHAPCCERQFCSYRTPEECVDKKRKTKALADRTAELCGSAWLPVVWQSCGWHAKVVSPCGHWKVHPHSIVGYMAFLGSKNEVGGIWSADGKTPAEAVGNVARIAVAQVKEYATMLGCILMTKDDFYVIGPNKQISIGINGLKKLKEHAGQ